MRRFLVTCAILAAVALVVYAGTEVIPAHLKVRGNITSTGTVTGVTGSFTTLTSGSQTLTGVLNADAGIKVDTTNFTVSGTTGAVHTAGDLDVATSKFTVAAATGDTAVAGTLGVTGAATLPDIVLANAGGAPNTGNATLTAGTVTVATTLASANSHLYVCYQTPKTGAAPQLTYSVTPGVSITIGNGDGADNTSVVTWFLTN